MEPLFIFFSSCTFVLKTLSFLLLLLSAPPLLYVQAQHAHLGENRPASLGHAWTSDGEGHCVLSPLVEAGARRSSFLWLRLCNRKRAPAPIGFARRSCSSGHRLGGLQQAPELEQLVVPYQTAPKDAAEGIAVYNENEMSVTAPKYDFIMFFIQYL